VTAGPRNRTHLDEEVAEIAPAIAAVRRSLLDIELEPNVDTPT